MQPSLIAALYPVKPEDVYMRLLDVLRHGGTTIDMQARINMLTDLYTMLHLEILGGYWQVALPQESWRLAGLTGRLEGQPADRQTVAGVAQVLHALGLLVSTTVTWEGSLPVEAQIIEDHRGKRMVRRVEHVDREAQVLRDLTPYTSTVHAVATFVQTAEASRHATATN